MPTPKAGYKIAGEKIPGTTTIIGRFKESGALVGWAYKTGRKHANDASKGLPDPGSLYAVTDDAANIGTIVHGLVDDDIHGRPYSLDNQDPRVLSAFEAYTKWKNQSGALIVATEMPLISTTHRFGGTPDAIASIEGQLCLLDWKTSNSIYTDHLVQLAAYRALWNENNSQQPLTGGSHLLRFSKEGGDFTHHYFADLSDAWEQFLLFRRAYDIDKELVKRVR